MLKKHLAALEQVGLSAAEAQIYLALVRNAAPMGASAVVTATGVPRSSVYPILTHLTDVGLLEGEAGYGGRFSAISAEKALPSLILRQKNELLQREQVADQLAKELKPLRELAKNNGEAELIQVLRDPRVITERFERLQLDAKRQVDLFVKSPIFNLQYTNPAQEKAMRRGVRYRCLYERAIVDAPEIQPYLSKWVAAGEEARLLEGELPHKLAIFDRQNILMPLVTPSGNGKTLFIRHPQLAMTLGIAFDSLWERAKPIPAELARPAKQERGRGRNGGRDSTEHNRTAIAS